MRRSTALTGWILGTALVLASCVAPAGQSSTPGDQAAPAAPVAMQTLALAIGAEVDNLSPKLGGGTNAAEYNFMTNSPLSLRDPKGAASPLLAAELPSQDAGTWVVNPDGTMRTTWKIRPSAVWHDGTGITPRDFALALEIYMDPSMPVANRVPERFMERVEGLDDRTFVIHWKQSYPWANELGARDLEPIPEHIVGPMYRQLDPDAFGGHSFWSSTDYIGSGPYLLVRWDPGTQLVFRAFDSYFMGRPKIDEIIFRIIPDTNTMVANLLSGEVATAIGATALGQQAGASVKEQWGRTGEGEVFITPVRFRHTQIQFDRAYLEQPAILDLRVRRAIVHGMDRQSMAQIVTAGLSRATEIFLSPNDPLYARAQPVIAKYSYDPNRSLALLQTAGWSKRGDTLVDGGGEPFRLDVRSTQGSDNQTELSIQAADLAKLGMQISQTMVPQSRIRDSEYRIKFPGLNNTALSIHIPDTLRRGVTAECPDPNRRYTGGNRGCWTNPEFDRLYYLASSSLDPNERANAMVDALRIMTEDIGVIGLTYTSENIPVRRGLIGPGARWPGQVGNTWNVHEWRWQG